MYETEKLNLIKEWIGVGSINIFGRPFAGKDSQGRKLSELFDGNFVGSGEILRGSNIPDRIKECMDTGQLIPSNDFTEIILPYLSQPQLVDGPLILSSVGRWHGEEEGVIRAVKESGHPLKSVIYLDISDEDIYSRWRAAEGINDRSNRHDDYEEVLMTRLAEFQAKTLPVIDYYRDLGLLIEIDGRLSRDEVTHNILDALIEQH